MSSYKERFLTADPEVIYLNGNSLGRLPKAAVDLSHTLVVEEWGSQLIRGWNGGWIDLPRRIGDKIAPLIDAQPGEVLVTDSTSANLYKLAVAALELLPERREIITEAENFPSDLYIFQGLQRRFPDLTIRLESDPVAALSSNTALISLSHVRFKSGYRHPMAQINEAAQKVGALTLWDLSHSVGAVPIDLSSADMAVGCTYKYVNGGPGAPAFLYVRRDLQPLLQNPVQGWFGQRDAFSFGLEYAPADGINRFAVGTPAVVSTALIEPGIDLMLEAGIGWIDAQRVRLSELVLQANLEQYGFELVTPTNPEERGSHVTFTHPEAWRISQALIDAKVHPDFRAPNFLRLGIAPLYIDESDIVTAIERLRAIMENRTYENHSQARPKVT
jgi:kynureninase